MTTPSSSPTSDQAMAGQAIYSKLTLTFYDLIVLNISNNYAWKCPTKHIQQLYQEHISPNHLEVGVGTGYFLKNCHFSTTPRIALMDLNPNCLQATATRLKPHATEQYQRNVLEPIAFSAARFDSLGINYVLHCLPGDIYAKAIVFENLKHLLNPGAQIFGSTILGKQVPLNAFARALTNVYNKKGVFSNLQDNFQGVKTILEKNFSAVHVELVGCVALFWARI